MDAPLGTAALTLAPFDRPNIHIDGRIAATVEDLPRLHELDGEHVGLRSAFGIRIGQNQSLAGKRSTQSLTGMG